MVNIYLSHCDMIELAGTDIAVLPYLQLRTMKVSRITEGSSPIAGDKGWRSLATRPTSCCSRMAQVLSMESRA